MKIAFDGQPLLNANKTGIAYYEDGLVKGMLKYYPENEYQLDVFTFRHKDRIEQLQKEYSHKLVLKKQGKVLDKKNCIVYNSQL